MRWLAVVWMVVKQVLNNWRLEASILAGLIIAVAVVSCVPIYTSGALQSVLVEQWMARTDPGRMPNTLMFYHDPLLESEVEDYHRVTEFLEQAVPARLGQPQLSSRLGEIRTSQFYSARDPRGQRIGYANIRFLTNLFDLIQVTDGRLPRSRRLPDGSIEAIVDETTLDSLGLLVGETYVFPIDKRGAYDTSPGQSLKVTVVGTFVGKVQPESAHAWLYLPPFDRSFFVTEQLFVEDLALIEDVGVGQYVWYMVLDHRPVRVDHLDRWIESFRYIESRVAQLMPGTRAWRSPQRLFQYFWDEASYLRLFMFALSVPILGMVLYFVVLAATLTVRRRRTEIAMLRSRGAGIFQIALAYVLEWGFLGVIALVLGPYLGLWMARAIGAASGFLQFVDRQSLPVILSSDAYLYGFVGLVIAIGACLIPVIQAARHSIVTHKQAEARAVHTPVWQRYLVDFLLLGISYWGYRMLSRQALSLRSGQFSATEAVMIIDPQLFLIPLVFVTALGLFVLRLFPLLMGLANRIIARGRGVCLPMTVLQMARNPGQHRPLLLLLIITVGSGIYGAATARTMDQNWMDQLRYKYGADVILQEQWQLPTAPGMGEDDDPEATLFVEPPFYIHEELPGVVAAARVFKGAGTVRVGGNYLSGGTIIGIDPVEYAGVGWLRSDLAPHHLYDYLNLLIQVPEGVLVSGSAAKAAGLRSGDWISVRIGNEDVDFMIVGTLEYWPTIVDAAMPFAVANLDYIQQSTTLQPYEVWLRVTPEFRLQTAVDLLREQGIWVINIKDLNRELVEGRREPQRMGLYGMLSLGFIVSVVITVMGYFLYTLLSLHSRMLQFGILRTIGLSLWQLIAMLSLEQLLSVGLGVLLGLGIGQLTSRLYLPFIQYGADVGADFIPFIVVTEGTDTWKIVGVLGLVLMAALIVLAVLLSRMRLHQAVKLGENI